MVQRPGFWGPCTLADSYLTLQRLNHGLYLRGGAESNVTYSQLLQRGNIPSGKLRQGEWGGLLQDWATSTVPIDVKLQASNGTCFVLLCARKVLEGALDIHYIPWMYYTLTCTVMQKKSFTFGPTTGLEPTVHQNYKKAPLQWFDHNSTFSSDLHFEILMAQRERKRERVSEWVTCTSIHPSAMLSGFMHSIRMLRCFDVEQDTLCRWWALICSSSKPSLQGTAGEKLLYRSSKSIQQRLWSSWVLY